MTSQNGCAHHPEDGSLAFESKQGPGNRWDEVSENFPRVVIWEESGIPCEAWCSDCGALWRGKVWRLTRASARVFAEKGTSGT